jgi:hypothetical protein
VELLYRNDEPAAVRVTGCGPFVVEPPHVAAVLHELTTVRQAG